MLPSAAFAAAVISVSPAVGTPDTAFHVEVPALFKIHQLRDRYYFSLHGPGGKSCDSAVTNRVGITPPRRARRVFVDLAPMRENRPDPSAEQSWCTGTFNGHVEFRDWLPKRHRYKVHRIGNFSVQVAQSQE